MKITGFKNERTENELRELLEWHKITDSATTQEIRMIFGSFKNIEIILDYGIYIINCINDNLTIEIKELIYIP